MSLYIPFVMHEMTSQKGCVSRVDSNCAKRMYFLGFYGYYDLETLRNAKCREDKTVIPGFWRVREYGSQTL